MPVGSFLIGTAGYASCNTGMGFHWHDLRHTWASWHAQDRTPLHVLQELGGWASSEMVQRYAHLATEHLSRWVDRRDGIGNVSNITKSLR